MGRILQHWRIPVATLFSVALIVGAYVLARGIESPPVAQASAETALLQAIAKKDSDNDGLPDWEEALYGTNPNNSDSFNLGMTDGEAVAKGLIVPKAIADIQNATSSPASVSPDSSVPKAAAAGSITDTFAKNFFTLYLATKQANGGNALSQVQVSTLAEQVMNQLAAGISLAPDFKSKADIKVSGAGADALRAYAIQAEDVFRAQGVQLPKNELQYLQDAVQNNDASALDNIQKIATAYRASAAGLAVLAVPEELADIHLALVNALARLGGGSGDFARSKTDPIAAMLALKQYPGAVGILAQTFKDIGNMYASEQITLPAGTPGASFVNVSTNVAAKQKAVSTNKP
jgi:hypothetical protein